VTGKFDSEPVHEGEPILDRPSEHEALEKSNMRFRK
jgi:hypothetical protein